MASSKGDRKQWVLVERQGWSERDAFEGETLEEIMEKLELKTGRNR